ncbi:MAG: NAD-dependent epimerase/dehydratase family protein [Candidatus Magasanikbacteria bacterium]|nr:NAD-dependent epimerase/dehydratase family protein [Candidatus Magasanikbacteria bacterium]
MKAGFTTLITGCSSGLGKYLHEEIDSVAFNRNCPPYALDIDTIIHCGWDTKVTDPSEKYIYNALDLVQRLCLIKHKRFIFISTIDVYNKLSLVEHEESEQIDVREITGLYAISKYFAENIILRQANNPIVIRPSTLMGKYSNNSIFKLNCHKPVRLSGESKLNIILYSQVKDFIIKMNNRSDSGIYNLVGDGVVALGDLFSDLDGLFGKFVYTCGKLSNKKLKQFDISLAKSSFENFQTWKINEN